MSGRKISDFGIAEQRRQNLRDQVECFQQSFVCHEEIRQAITYLGELDVQIRSLLDTLALSAVRAGDRSREIGDLKKIQTSLSRECSALRDELAAHTPPYR
jgi:hypothetical protein